MKWEKNILCSEYMATFECLSMENDASTSTRFWKHAFQPFDSFTDYTFTSSHTK